MSEKEITLEIVGRVAGLVAAIVVGFVAVIVVGLVVGESAGLMTIVSLPSDREISSPLIVVSSTS